jgi:hypothetical protein
MEKYILKGIHIGTSFLQALGAGVAGQTGWEDDVARVGMHSPRNTGTSMDKVTILINTGLLVQEVLNFCRLVIAVHSQI